MNTSDSTARQQPGTTTSGHEARQVPVAVAVAVAKAIEGSLNLTPPPEW